MDTSPLLNYPLIFFDGYCNLCNFWVDFLIKTDRAGKLHFASLQSEAGGRLKNDYPSLQHVDSVVVLHHGKVFVKSTAVLYIIRFLPWYFQWLRAGLLIPSIIRDWLYDRIARRRFRWFGKRNTCRMPSPEEKSRFIE